MRTVDTSVIVPALSAWHELHDIAFRSLAGVTTVIGHCLVEAYSVLTRLPVPYRIGAADAARVLDAAFGSALTLEPDKALKIPSVLASHRVVGGAAYDGLIGIVAAQHGTTLITLDHRAARTYRAVGVQFELLVA